MNISITIMGHPKRDANIQALLIQLINMQRFCDVSVTLDSENSEWHTGKRALQAGIGKKSDWHVVIQDDVILTPDFYTNLVGCLNSLPTKTLLSLYTGTARPLAERVAAAVAKTPDGGLLRFHQLLWGVGIAIPTDHIEPMLDFVENIALQYDNRVGEFYCQNNLPVYYCIPSLVDHDDDTDTLLAGHGRHISPERRVAHRLATGPIEWHKKSPTYI